MRSTCIRRLTPWALCAILISLTPRPARADSNGDYAYKRLSLGLLTGLPGFFGFDAALWLSPRMSLDAILEFPFFYLGWSAGASYHHPLGGQVRAPHRVIVGLRGGVSDLIFDEKGNTRFSGPFTALDIGYGWRAPIFELRALLGPVFVFADQGLHVYPNLSLRCNWSFWRVKSAVQQIGEMGSP